MLADWAGIAIEHARLYESSRRHSVELNAPRAGCMRREKSRW